MREMVETAYRNRILRALSPADRQALADGMTREPLRVGQIIEPRDVPLDRIYFPESGVASVVAVGQNGKKMETGPFGWEGMSGLPVVHEVSHSPTETIVQIEGEALVAPAAAVEALVRNSAAARTVMLRYSYAFALQGVQMALAAGLSSVERRLSRWLLMLHDRVDGDEIRATHDFMAMMLGVRRPGVTVALHMLEGRHLIRSTRGSVVIRDREGLERFCGAIYGLPEREFARLIRDYGT